MDEQHNEAQGDAPAPTHATRLDVLYVDLTVVETVRTAPNPLSAARPEQLESYRQSVHSVVAARRAGLG